MSNKQINVKQKDQQLRKFCEMKRDKMKCENVIKASHLEIAQFQFVHSLAAVFFFLFQMSFLSYHFDVFCRFTLFSLCSSKLKNEHQIKLSTLEMTSMENQNEWTTKKRYSQVGGRMSLNIKYDLFIVLTPFVVLPFALVALITLARGWNSDAVTTVWRGTIDGSAIIWRPDGNLFTPIDASRFIDAIGWINDAVTDCGALVPPINVAFDKPCVFGNFMPAGIVLKTDAVTVFGVDFGTVNWVCGKTRFNRISGSFSASTLSIVFDGNAFSMSSNSIELFGSISKSDSNSDFTFSVEFCCCSGFCGCEWCSCCCGLSSCCNFNFSDFDNELNASNWLHEYISFLFNKSLQKLRFMLFFFHTESNVIFVGGQSRRRRRISIWFFSYTLLQLNANKKKLKASCSQFEDTKKKLFLEPIERNSIDHSINFDKRMINLIKFNSRKKREIAQWDEKRVANEKTKQKNNCKPMKISNM